MCFQALIIMMMTVTESISESKQKNSEKKIEKSCVHIFLLSETLWQTHMMPEAAVTVMFTMESKGHTQKQKT